jgi:hypothetical protein
MSGKVKAGKGWVNNISSGALLPFFLFFTELND